MTPSTTRPRDRSVRRAEQQLRWVGWGIGGLVAVLAVVLAVLVATGDEEASTSASGLPLPNPMGGPAQHAPQATGEPVSVGALEIAAPTVEMGDVPLDVTVVPSWTVTNPTGREITLLVGQPQVLEGCCPGPVFVGEQMVAPGEPVTVPAGTVTLVQFPLQMHPGMDGPHHLTVPLAVDGHTADLHVTGNFTADA